METIKNFLTEVGKLWAKFYNALPSRIRIYVYSGTSLLASTILGLISRDLLALELSNEYIVAFVLFITGLINEIQKSLVDAGVKKLAEEKDPNTLKNLNAKLKETKDLINQ